VCFYADRNIIPTLYYIPKSNVDTVKEQKHSRYIYEQNELQRRDTYQTIFDEKEEAAPFFIQQEISSH